jgi:hypothetical protein
MKKILKSEIKLLAKWSAEARYCLKTALDTEKPERKRMVASLMCDKFLRSIQMFAEENS